MLTATQSIASKMALPRLSREPRRLLNRLRGRRPTAAGEFDEALNHVARSSSALVAQAATGESRAVAVAPLKWAAWRIDLMERLWGKGFLLPGGAEFVSVLTKPLNLNPKASVLVLGAGMGAPSNLIAQEFGAFVDGVEPDSELAAASSARAAVVKGMSRVAIKNLSIDEGAAFARKYDAIFSQEILLQCTDKPALLARCANALKTNGKLVITEFVRDDATDNAIIAPWLIREQASAPLLNEDEMRALHASAGFRMRTVEDMSDHYINLVLTGWGMLERSLRASAAERETLRGMIAEAERWAERVMLLKSDKVRYTRFFATKKTVL